VIKKIFGLLQTNFPSNSRTGLYAPMLYLIVKSTINYKVYI